MRCPQNICVRDFCREVGRGSLEVDERDLDPVSRAWKVPRAETRAKVTPEECTEGWEQLRMGLLSREENKAGRKQSWSPEPAQSHMAGKLEEGAPQRDTA